MFNCEICNKNYKTKKIFIIHLQTNKHIRNLDLQNDQKKQLANNKSFVINNTKYTLINSKI